MAVALMSGAMIAVPRLASAATHTLSGSQTTTQSVTTDTDPTVTVNTQDSNFSVNNTTSGNAVTISGAGNIIYDDLGNDNSLTATASNSSGLSITSTGNNGGTAGSVTVTNSGDITGAWMGIRATNSGTGGITINSTGTLTSTSTVNNGDGLTAYNTNAAATGDVIVNVHDVTGVDYGLDAENAGLGDVSVTSTGTVSSNSTAIGYDGIYAAITNAASNGNVTVIANNATGGLGSGGGGIITANHGTGNISVTVNGEASGTYSGVDLEGYGGTLLLTLNPGSSVHNITGNSSDRAISLLSYVAGPNGTINNSGTITGTVRGYLGNDTINNYGTWNSAGGISNFDAGNDVFNNEAGGIFRAANSGAVSPVSTSITNMETVTNAGSITMQNGIVGDSLTFTNGGNGVFNANGGTLYVDTNLADRQSDVLHLDNVSGGPTLVDLNVVDPEDLGQPITSYVVQIVDVSGTSSPNAFALDHPISGGLYSYNLQQGPSGWYLLGDGARPEATAAGVLPILGSRTALSTLSNVNDRQRDEKVLSDNADTKKGVWARAFGGSNDFDANDSNDFGFDSHLWGAQAGIDLLADGDAAGNRKYGGLYVAYASSSGDATQHGNNVASLDLDATTLGAYYTKYSSKNWYLDAVAQYSWLNGIHAKTDTDNISPGGSGYALSLEVGQQFRPQANIIREVQAQLIYQNTDIDDVTLDDDTHLHLSEVNAVTGRLGVRLYGNPKSGKNFLPWARANLWHTFATDASVSSLGNTISTPVGGTSGELEVGFSNGSAQSGGWGFYGSAGYLFDLGGAQYSGWKGTLGLRKGW